MYENRMNIENEIKRYACKTGSVDNIAHII